MRKIEFDMLDAITNHLKEITRKLRLISIQRMSFYMTTTLQV